ncbi:hypothetical protein HYY74_04445 [Candidatus Woesearchaeota archaeon]|nr:hypothetical protein [Candidatus Woesearchaeota archaeon]
MPKISLLTPTANDTVNLALDTIRIGKQALIFVGTRPSAEKTAEDISKKLGTEDAELEKLSLEILHALSRPTKQCERLALCVKKGIAFHHSGLTHAQRTAVENGFRNGKIRIICCTPTLCLSGDTKIWHESLETPLSNFNGKAAIFSLCGTSLVKIKPEAIERLENSSELIGIETVSGHSIKATPNHRFFVKRKVKKLIAAAGIQKGDRIATVGKIHIEPKQASLKDFVKDNELPIKNQIIEGKISYFIGAMLGDGHSGAEMLSDKIRYKGSPCLVGIDGEIFSAAQEVCNILQIRYAKKTNYHGTPQLVLSKKKWVREFFLRCGIDKLENKHLSEKLETLDLNSSASLLRGLFDTDGYVQKSRNIGFSNISERLVKQMQKQLLRFGIVSRIRKASTMKIYQKVYNTKESFELTIAHKRSILDFYKCIGFGIERKQTDLLDIALQISSNINYIECGKCKYKLYSNIFSGRSKSQKRWGAFKLKVISILGERGELGSKELKNILGFGLRKKDSRLNHHYQLIQKRRTGSRSKTEWYWKLNDIGMWVYNNIIKLSKNIEYVQSMKVCPLCNSALLFSIKKGWRDSDIEGDIFWDIIRSLKKLDAETFVYDVVLPNFPKSDHMFVANGFILHNSAGLDIPAYRAVIRDLRRFGKTGLNWIPVLEYLQMSGRAGRPKYDSEGQAITIASSEPEKDEIHERYILGEPEEIYSKLAVEPVLRTYLLSLIATRFTKNHKEIMEFFSKTFWAHQFREMPKLEATIMRMLALLAQWEFITGEDFIGANELADETKIHATPAGRRVAELYLDPYTANHIITCLRRGRDFSDTFPLLLMICTTLEMRPLIRAGARDYDAVQEKLAEQDGKLLQEEPGMYEEEYEEFANAVKTSMFLNDWIQEKDEEYLLERYKVRPGEIHAKLDLADWLLYSSIELAKLMQLKHALPALAKLRLRVQNGAKEELLPLLRLKGIGRVRARRLFTHGITDIGAVKRAEQARLAEVIGAKVAEDIKKQVGQEQTQGILKFGEEKVE